MGWLKSFVRNPVGTVLNTAKEVVTDPGKVINDIGKTIDQSIIKPIENDPLTFIVAAVAYSYGIPGLEFAGAGSAASVGVATTGSRLAQGDEFDQAVKKGVTAAAVTAAVNYGRDYYRQNAGSGAPVPVENRVVPVDAPVEVSVDPAAALSTKPVNVDLSGTDLPASDFSPLRGDASRVNVDTSNLNLDADLKLDLATADRFPDPSKVNTAAPTVSSNIRQDGSKALYESALNDPSINAAEPPYVPGSGNQASTTVADRFVNPPVAYF